MAKQLIEEKIQNATEEQIKKVISCAEKYAIDCEYMEPLRAVDVMASYLELAVIFESEIESNE